MNLLIVEDDENKRNQIVEFISQSFSPVTILLAKSFQSGLRTIIAESLDLVLLDMAMPTFDIGGDEDGGRPQAYAGREILQQMDRREIVLPVIVVTQFDKFGQGRDALTLAELDAQLRAAHPESYVGSVYYSTSLEDWKEELWSMMHTVWDKENGIEDA